MTEVASEMAVGCCIRIDFVSIIAGKTPRGLLETVGVQLAQFLLVSILVRLVDFKHSS